MEDFIPYKRWLHQHDNDIRQEFPDRPTETLADEMDLNYYTVSRRASRLGVSKSSRFMHTSWKKGGMKRHVIKSELKEEIARYMREHFANTKNETLAEHFDVDVKTVRRWARRLGLVKSEAFMRSARTKSHIWDRPFYTPEQIAWRNRRIAEVYPESDDGELLRLADELGLSVSFVRQLANGLGLCRKACAKYNKELVDALADYFPTHTDKECAAKFGIGKTTVQYLARKHGLRKDDAHLRKVHDGNIAAAHEFNRRKRNNKY